MPHPFARAHVVDGVQRIDRSRIRRPRAGDDGERREAGAPIGGDRLVQEIHAQPESIVGRDRPHAIRHDAGELRRLQHRVVRLVRRVQHAAANLGAEMPLARADDRVEGRHRAAGGEETARLRRKPHPVAQPVERVGLELHERGRRLPYAGVAVGRVGDEVGERRRIEAAARDVREIARARRGERARNPVAEQLIEQRLERDALLRRRFAHRAAQLRRVHVAADRLAIERRDVRDAAPDDLVGHRAHALG